MGLQLNIMYAFYGKKNYKPPKGHGSKSHPHLRRQTVPEQELEEWRWSGDLWVIQYNRKKWADESKDESLTRVSGGVYGYRMWQLYVHLRDLVHSYDPQKSRMTKLHYVIIWSLRAIPNDWELGFEQVVQHLGAYYLTLALYSYYLDFNAINSPSCETYFCFIGKNRNSKCVLQQGSPTPRRWTGTICGLLETSCSSKQSFICTYSTWDLGSTSNHSLPQSTEK